MEVRETRLDSVVSFNKNNTKKGRGGEEGKLT